jgi:hypothetical protein
VSVLLLFATFPVVEENSITSPSVDKEGHSNLSVFRLEKFVFICVRNEFAVIQSFNVEIVDIVFYEGIVRQVHTGIISQAISQLSFQNFQVSDQVLRSFQIPVIIGDTVLLTHPH